MRLHPVQILAALFMTPLIAHTLRAGEPECPFTVVTTAGDRIGSLDPVRNSGKRVTFRACLTRTLVAFAASEIDWPATEQANLTPVTPTPALPAAKAPTPSLSGLAAGRKLLEPEKLEAIQQGQGKMTVGGKTFEINSDGPYFGKESVAVYLAINDIIADVSNCPGSRARVLAEVVNLSKLKLRGMKGALLIGNKSTREKLERIESMDPADILPAETSLMQVFIPCGWLEAKSGYSQSSWRREDLFIVLRDVSGKAEPLLKPDPSKAAGIPTPKVKN
jgi:hypothetical protein